MTGFDDERLMAYVDGELGPQVCSEIEAAMAADPVLAERVARHRALRQAAAQAFAGVLSEPVPERLLRAAGKVEILRPSFGASRAAAGRPPWLQLAAMAACLVVGLAVGRSLEFGEPAALAPAPGGGLQARGVLAAALDRQLAAEPGVKKISVGLSFRSKVGGYCRTFQMSREALAGLACRREGRWAAVMVTGSAVRGGDPQGYRMAASAAPPAVLAAVDEMIDGAPLDREQEIAARASGWRP